MDFDLTPEEEAFRDDLRAFLDEHLPPPGQRPPDFLLRWWKAVREKRLIGFSWPVEVTGGGGSLMEQFILKEELLARKAPMLGKDLMGLAWVGPAVAQFGTDEQKQKYIPEILVRCPTSHQAKNYCHTRSVATHSKTQRKVVR